MKEMTDLNKEKETVAEEVVNQAAQTEQEKTEQPEETTEQKLTAEIEQLKKQLNEEKDLGLRVRAEYDNYRKRTAREMGEINANVRVETLTEILPIADNIERALASAEGNEAELRRGVAMIQQQIDQIFTKLNIETIGEENVPFDPQIHNAVMHIEDETIEESTVIQVFQKGYKLGNKVLRYAMVKVAN